MNDSKIEKFWNWFLQHSEQMTMLNDLTDEESRNLLEALQGELDSYCPDLSFEISEPTPSGRTLTVSAEGDLDLFGKVSDLVEQAPDIDWWEFVAFKQPQGKRLKVTFDKYHFNTSEMYFTELENEESPDMMGLRIALKDCLPDDEDQLVGVYATLEALLGEFDCATLLGYFDTCPVPAEPFKEGFKSLDDLPEFVEWFKNH
ncbi:MAG: hypothetical protein IJL38_02705 [Bacteroidales bacterium]|nr:hypothetical protein [Bacteroidales bacterium]